MKRKHLIYLTGTLTLLTFFMVACQDTYTPKDLNNDDKILVINGEITNDSHPHEVTIAWATPFLETAYEYVSGATVTIVDGNDNEYVLAEQSTGYYYTSYGQLTGIPGQSYYLKVMLADGSTYFSQTATMQQPDTYDSLYAEAGDKRSLVELDDGSRVVQKEEGIYVYLDMNIPSTEKKYFRFESIYASQNLTSIQAEDKVTGQPVTKHIRCIESGYLNSVPDVKTTSPSGGMQIIKRHPIGFFKYKLGFLKLGLYTDPKIYTIFPKGTIVTINTYAVNKEEYSYFEKISAQLRASNQFFDPLPTAIRGNMKSLDNPSEKVLGFFSVAAKMKTCKGINMNINSKIITYQDVSNDYIYDTPASFCNDSIIPPYWVTF